MLTTASGPATLLTFIGFRYRTTGICLVVAFLPLCSRMQRFVPPSGLYPPGCSAHAASLEDMCTIRKLLWVVALQLSCSQSPCLFASAAH